jgi:GxxExxY protein
MHLRALFFSLTSSVALGFSSAKSSNIIQLENRVLPHLWMCKGQHLQTRAVMLKLMTTYVALGLSSNHISWTPVRRSHFSSRLTTRNSRHELSNTTMCMDRYLIHQYAKQVMVELGIGHTERVYHQAMIVHLNRLGVIHRSEVVCPYFYMDTCVGFGKADLVVGDVVVELKAQDEINFSSVQQLRKYRDALTKCEMKKYKGLVVNFNQRFNTVDAFPLGDQSNKEEDCSSP